MASARIIVPCYNEGARLDLASFQSFKNSSHAIAFVLVNDGSTDNTLQLLQSLNALDPTKFTILNLPKNRGKAEAVRQGYLSAIESHPDYIGFWDADLATPLDAIVQFIELAERRGELEIVIGSRVKLLGRKIDRRPARHYLGRFFATAVSVMLDLAVYDTQCGAKLFRVSPPINALFDRPFHSRWIFDVEIIARLIQSRRGTPLPQPAQIIYEFPLTEWTDVPGSKLTSADFIRAAWELLQIRRHYFGKDSSS
jgi:glycosyltransferase involved in cell wall biosynthesis